MMPEWTGSHPPPVVAEPEPEACGCDESKKLRAELETVRAERNYLLTGCSPSEVRTMRQELAKEK